MSSPTLMVLWFYDSTCYIFDTNTDNMYLLSNKILNGIFDAELLQFIHCVISVRVLREAQPPLGIPPNLPMVHEPHFSSAHDHQALLQWHNHEYKSVNWIDYERLSQKTSYLCLYFGSNLLIYGVLQNWLCSFYWLRLFLWMAGHTIHGGVTVLLAVYYCGDQNIFSVLFKSLHCKKGFICLPKVREEVLRIVPIK